MDHDKKGVLNRAVFDASARQQSTSIARRVEQLDGALQRDERQNDPQNAQDVPFSSNVKPAVKPGPSALTSARFHGAESAIARSSTNITVAADMFP